MFYTFNLHSPKAAVTCWNCHALTYTIPDQGVVIASPRVAATPVVPYRSDISLALQTQLAGLGQIPGTRVGQHTRQMIGLPHLPVRP